MSRRFGAPLVTTVFILTACSGSSSGGAGAGGVQAGAGGTGGGGGSPGELAIQSFRSDPGAVPEGGGTVTLRWEVTGANTLRIDPGIGTVSGDSVEAQVDETTTFTLTVSNAEATVESSTTVFSAMSESAPRPFDLDTPSSIDIIERDLTDGEIDDVTALRYKIFALYGDDRLPPEYQAEGPIHGSPITYELAARFDELPREVQAEMRPFMLPPSNPESWRASLVSKGSEDQFYDFNVVQTEADGKIEIWWNDSLNDKIEKYIQFWVAGGADTAWDILIDLMGTDREPLPSLGADQPFEVFVILDPTESDLGWCSFGNLDSGLHAYPTHIYINLFSILTDEDDRGELVIADGNQELTLATVAHELMHAIQGAFNSVDRQSRQHKWLRESTATWAEHYVYPTFNTEQDYADGFLKVPWLPLDNTRGVHEYGGYLFPFYLSGLFPDSTIRTIWENTESDKVFEAIDNALGGSLDQEWASFTAYNWNETPLDDYSSWDGLMKSVADQTDTETIEITAQQNIYEMSLAASSDAGPVQGVDYLSAQYFHFDLTDTSIHTILFANGYSFELHEGSPQGLGLVGDTTYYAEELTEDGKKGAHVQALVRAEGEWELLNYDLTDIAFVPFCQDYAEESIEELVLIFSNSRFGEGNRTQIVPKGLSPRLFVSNVACGDWLGDATLTREINSPPELVESSEAFFNNLEYTRARWPRAELLGGAGQFESMDLIVPGGVAPLDFLFGNYMIENAEITWSTYLQTDDQTRVCVSEGMGEAGTEAIGAEILDIRPNLLSSSGPGSLYRSYTIAINMVTSQDEVDVTCTGDPPMTTAFGAAITGGGRDGPVVFEISDDGIFIDQQWSPDFGATQLELSLVGVAD